MAGKPTPPEKGTAEFSWLMPGRWLKQESNGTIMGQPMKTFMLLGYDNFKMSYVSTQVSNLDTAMTHAEGDMDPGGKALLMYGTLDEYTTGEHDKMVRYIWRFPSADRMILEIHDLPIGENNTKVIEVVYHARVVVRRCHRRRRSPLSSFVESLARHHSDGGSVMFGFTVDRHIAAPPDVVFARASDFHRAPETISAIVKMDVLTGRTRGCRHALPRDARDVRPRGDRGDDRHRVRAAEALHAGAESHGSRYHTELSFAPDGQGTRVSDDVPGHAGDVHGARDGRDDAADDEERGEGVREGSRRPQSGDRGQCRRVQLRPREKAAQRDAGADEPVGRGGGHAASHADVELRLTPQPMRGAGIDDPDRAAVTFERRGAEGFGEAVPAGGDVAIDRDA